MSKKLPNFKYRNPKAPRYQKQAPFTPEGTLHYIFKHYGLRISEDINLQKILQNSLRLTYISSGSQADTFKIIFDKKFIIEDGKTKTMLYPDKEYVLKLSYTSLKCKDIIKTLSKHDLIPKIYFIANIFTIMDYIDGDTLDYFFYKLNQKYKKNEIDADMYEQILNLVEMQAQKILGKIYKFYNSQEIDSGTYTNFLIDKNYKVYFIDPCN